MPNNNAGSRSSGTGDLAIFLIVVAVIVWVVQWLGKGNNFNWALIVLGWIAFFVYLVVGKPAKPSGGWVSSPYFMAIPPILVGLVVSMILTAYDILNTPVYALMLIASLIGILYWIFRGPRLHFPRGIPSPFGWGLITLAAVVLVSIIGLPLENRHRADQKRDKSNSYLTAAGSLLANERFDALSRVLAKAREADPQNPAVYGFYKRLRKEEKEAALEVQITSAIASEKYGEALDLASGGPAGFERTQQGRIAGRIVSAAEYQLYRPNSRSELEQLIDNLKVANSFGGALTQTLAARAEVALQDAREKLNRLDNPVPAPEPAPSSPGSNPGGSSGGDTYVPDVDIPFIPGT